MQDRKTFFRQRALAAFRRRKGYRLLSADWLHTVRESRQFLAAFRRERLIDDLVRRVRDGAITREKAAAKLGPNVWVAEIHEGIPGPNDEPRA